VVRTIDAVRIRRPEADVRGVWLILVGSLVFPALMAPSVETGSGPQPARRGVTRAPFGTLRNNTPVEIYTLTNASGTEMRVTNYGGIITSLKVSDRSGSFGDVVLGFDTLEGYLKDPPYFGALIGRYGNRIAKGQFTLDGRIYKLAVNNGPNHLHGGIRGFDKVLWNAMPTDGSDGVSVTLTRTSPDGEEGYPGNLQVTVRYMLTDKNELMIDYRATTDRSTPINLTQHSYFNLAADGGDILGHELMLNATRYTPVDDTLIPTGELATVQGTPFDFRKATAIGARIDAGHVQLKNGKGYDHNWVLDRTGTGLERAAAVFEPKTGRTLEIATTEPGVQFYSGNFLDGTIIGKGRRVYQHRSGFCLETQHFPDSPNHSNFPTTVLQPGKTYASKTVFTFGVRK
jgi:aldose 1-epimerase